MGKQKIKNIHVICPGFSSDCLETLEEINIEGKSIFLDNGGKNYNYIPALNTNPDWIKAMGEILNSNLQGWIDQDWSLVKQQKKSALTKKQAENFKFESNQNTAKRLQEILIFATKENPFFLYLGPNNIQADSKPVDRSISCVLCLLIYCYRSV